MHQRWHDLLFAHWPLPPAALDGRLPPGLRPDLFDGHAWLGVVPFRMSGVRLAGLPPLPGSGAFPELNVRTYVRHGEQPGVWFFSLDAASRLAVEIARRWFALPYFHARMSCAADGEGIRYASRRVDARGAPAELRARYAPLGPPAPSAPGTLEDFLTNRLTLFATDRRGRLVRGDVEHARWPLQPARAELELNTMGAALGLRLEGPPRSLLFARRLDVRIGAPRAVG
jgi:uncharacterized protein YqjF (DUF2071 family)